ncbi:hypothetical protein U1E44_03945 [Arenibacter sp. GZD96]|uniref:hypothetical protein n=1 Tax=Aurantibrevibacter litoralis TaxID=3106030 RepID=UPI002AFE68DA|nr:hypothetical protein [Arenibacter sp. GZD-96]MEA1785232.1 hypothetical protein [Arenibacter sp. GZD-96]
MKNIGIFGVLLLLLAKPFWPIAEYIVNFDYIVNVLCENKDNAKLQCDGKCYLMKKLAQASEGAHDNPFEKNQTKNELELHWVVWFPAPFLFKNTIDAKVVHHFKTTQNVLTFLFTSDIAQPPELG